MKTQIQKKSHIVFLDSYGQHRTFPLTASALSGLRKRKAKYIIGEVLELIHRIYVKRAPFGNAWVSPENLGLELNIRPFSIRKVLFILRQKGLLSQKQKGMVRKVTVSSDLPPTKPTAGWCSNYYIITRDVCEDDYRIE